ncbi:unnamed protein product [Paramecium sonneborni]|uniref:Uncharacterized protein n=1 Tax=Paramecium sonneborni TaxID=65129 RepID=A0A8S1N7G7_9CILI|nr:unnamed protein product [Paramecium sonneborni]
MNILFYYQCQKIFRKEFPRKILDIISFEILKRKKFNQKLSMLICIINSHINQVHFQIDRVQLFKECKVTQDLEVKEKQNINMNFIKHLQMNKMKILKKIQEFLAPEEQLILILILLSQDQCNQLPKIINQNILILKKMNQQLRSFKWKKNLLRFLNNILKIININ